MCMDYMEKINKLFFQPEIHKFNPSNFYFEDGYYGYVITYFNYRIDYRYKQYRINAFKIYKIIRSYVLHHSNKRLSDHKIDEEKLIAQFEKQFEINENLGSCIL